MATEKQIDQAAQASGKYSDEEWAKLIASRDPFDIFTVANARGLAANILDIPELRKALAR